MLRRTRNGETSAAVYGGTFALLTLEFHLSAAAENASGASQVVLDVQCIGFELWCRFNPSAGNILISKIVNINVGRFVGLQ